MSAPLINRLLYAACLWFLAACSNTRHLPKDDALYVGSTVNITADDLSAREKKVLKNDLNRLTRPRPNSRFLGIPIKLSIYNLFYKAKPNSFFGRLRDRLGEPPVLFSSFDLDYNRQVLESHVENKGFFYAQVTADTTVKNKKARAEFSVDAGNQYHINDVAFIMDSSDKLTTTINESSGASLLKKGDAYDLDVIKGERIRIDAYLKERGFYYFSPNYLLVQVDSSIGNHLVNMRVTVKPETPPEARQVYRIRNIYLYSGFSLQMDPYDSSFAHAKAYEDYYVIDPVNRFKPKMFAQALQFRKGEVYNRKDHNLTLNRLIDLDEFKFVNNRFEPLTDSAAFDVYYYLTPMARKSLTAEFTTTTKSNNLNGVELSVSWLHRNIFRAGEHFSISAYGGTETQFGGNFKGYNTYRSGAELNLSIPRFFVPITDIRTRGGYVPRTHLKVGYDLMNRKKLYTLNSYRFGFGYLWRESLQKSHEFYPISITYVQPLNVTQEYRDSIRKYPYLNRIIDSQFVLGTTYRYNYNGVANGIQELNSFYFSGLLDLSGNIAGLIAGSDASEGKQKKLFNAVFDQFIKMELDGRYYRRIGINSAWANRIILGYGLPYGNSLQLPYIKQFFSGGNNSIRAFRSRTLLGSYRFPDSTGFWPDQTGDIKLEFNTEYRPHISGPLYGALFIDAGNTWLKREDSTRPGAAFSNRFLRELAVGAGVGLRLDIRIFVIRFDVAVPIRKPWEQNPSRVRLGDGNWRRDNLIYNLAIGYPF